MSDLISRQDVYCILEKMMVDRPLDSDRWVIRDIDKEIKSLPSVDRPTGEWEHDVDGHFFCTNCKKYPEYQVRMSDYCPNCGADMRGSDSE